MLSYSKNEVILVRYPFSALSGVKVRPAIVVVVLTNYFLTKTAATTCIKARDVFPRLSYRVAMRLNCLSL